jgi:hypothetical protein
MIRHGPHCKRRVQQFVCFCMCIRYRDNFSTEPLPSNDRGIFTEPLASNDRGIYIETQTDGRDFFNQAAETGLDTKFNKDWFRRSTVNGGGGAGKQTAPWSHKPNFIFFKIGKVGLN